MVPRLVPVRDAAADLRTLGAAPSAPRAMAVAGGTAASGERAATHPRRDIVEYQHLEECREEQRGERDEADHLAYPLVSEAA